MMNGVPVHVEKLSIIRGGKELYRDFSLDVAADQVLAVIAPSGLGKTTLLDFIGGVLPSENVSITGSAVFGTENTSQRSRPRISYLFQEGLLIQGATVLQNVAFPLVNVMPVSQAHERAMAFLRQAGLEKKAASYPYQLSGGEKQRTAIVRAFAYPSQILLMDEAFQSQDLRLKVQLIDLFKTMLADTGRTVLFVTHEIREAVSVADRILVMDGSPMTVLLDTENVPDSSYTMISSRASEIEKRIINLLTCSR